MPMEFDQEILNDIYSDPICIAGLYGRQSLVIYSLTKPAIALYHREDGPAIYAEGFTAEWWQYNVRHRLDGPAIIDPNLKCEEWWQYGIRHRIDGPAISFHNGRECWYKNDELHRIGGPAKTHANGHQEWYQNGKRHRIDGPAVINSEKYKFYIDDNNITHDVHKWMNENNITYPFTQTNKIEFFLKFS